MRRIVLLGLASTVLLMASEPASIPLFPRGVPGGKRVLGPEADTTTAKDGRVMGKPVIRLGNVTEPSLTFYPASSLGNPGATIVVFPGGGYRILAYDLEGTEICSWLNSIGVNAVLVKYRVPEPAGIPEYQQPLQDAQRAIGYVRSHAAGWKIDPERIGVLGFSAGGHLAALVSNNYSKRTYELQDTADGVSCRPDFSVLIYPAYLAEGEKLETLAPEITVTPKTPPTFLVQTEDDPVHVESSLVYYRALKAEKIPSEMHIFSSGGHGYGMRADPKKAVTHWPDLTAAWLKSLGIIP